MNLRETYNRIAEEWHRDHQKDSWWVTGTDRFISLLPPNPFVLDVGCGGGTKSKYLVDHGVRVYGIDFSQKMIDIASREVPRASFQVLDIMEANTLNRDFDGVFLQAVLLHIEKKTALLALERSIAGLKSNGYVYIAVKGKREGGVDEETKTENDYGYPYQRFFSYYTQQEVEDMLKQLQVEVCHLNSDESNNTTWIQVIGRKM